MRTPHLTSSVCRRLNSLLRVRAKTGGAQSSYSGRSSRSAQARETALLGVSVPGTVAQPPFSMISRRSQVEALPNSVNFAGASACAWNFSTQIGVSTSTTAASARSFAIRSAVPPSVHPKTEKPSTDMPAAPITAPQIPGFKLEGSFMDLMTCAPVSSPLVTIRVTAFARPSLLVRHDNTWDHVCKSPQGDRSPDIARFASLAG